MFTHNASSSAWQKICQLVDRPADKLARLGLSIPLFPPPPTPRERHLEAGPCILTFRLEDGEISASITSVSAPTGQLPKPKRFRIEGDTESPRFVERGGADRDADETFHDVVNWFLACSKSTEIKR